MPRCGLLGPLVCITLLAVSSSQGILDGQERLESQVRVLEAQLNSGPKPEDRLRLTLELAGVLHTLNQQAPDGGSRVPRAAELYRSAVVIAPFPAAKMAILSSLGSLLLSAQDVLGAQEAIHGSDALYAEEIRLNPQAASHLSETWCSNALTLASTFQIAGKPEDSVHVLRERVLTEEGLNQCPSHWAKAMGMLPRLMESDVKRIKRALPALEAKLTPADLGFLFFALFRAYRAKGDFETAWKHLVRANTLQDLGQPDANLEADLHTLRGVFLGQAKGQDHQSQRWRQLVNGSFGYADATPIFIIGMPRSGSSLIESVLAAHPSVWGAGEDTALAPYMPQLIDTLTSGRWLTDAGAKDIHDLGKAYIEAMRRRLPSELTSSVTHIVDKMLFNVWNLGFISMFLPKATIIHADRHPADTILSCFAQPFERRGVTWANNLSLIAERQRQTAEVMDLWNLVLGPGRVHRILYEDLVRYPEEAARKLLNATGLHWDPVVLNFHADKRVVATASALQVRQPLYRSSIGTFRSFEQWLSGTLQSIKDLVRKYEVDAGLAWDKPSGASSKPLISNSAVHPEL